MVSIFSDIFMDANISKSTRMPKSIWSQYHNENRIANPFVSVSQTGLFYP